MSTVAQVLVLAKEPRPGRVKTRLAASVGPVRAAELAQAALLDTLEAADGCTGARTVLVLDGSPGGWVPPAVSVLPQRDGLFGQRLDGALQDAWQDRALPMLLIGMDTPQVTPALLRTALDTLLTAGTQAVLGPAEDGGWWALGLRAPVAGLFDGVPMSTSTTGAAQAARLRALGLHTTALPTLRDVDLVTDARAVAALQDPPRRFAAAMARLAPVAA